MRILCLHGKGTNAEIFESQLAGLQYALRNDRHDFVYIEGSLACPAAPGIRESFPEQTDFFEYFDEQRPDTIETAVNDLNELLAAEEPPFDSIIGFSQGAVLAATMLAEQIKNPDIFPHVKFAVLICCGLMPGDSVNKRLHDPDRDGNQVIKAPTFHVVGKKDPLCETSLKVAQLCDPQLRKTYDHQGSHEIPRAENVTEALADGVRYCIQMAHELQ